MIASRISSLLPKNGSERKIIGRIDTGTENESRETFSKIMQEAEKMRKFVEQYFPGTRPSWRACICRIV